MFDEKQQFILQHANSEESISLGDFEDEQEALKKADEIMPHWRIKRYRLIVAEPKILKK